MQFLHLKTVLHTLVTVILVTVVHANPLETAKTLADTRFKDWTCGSTGANKIDCVQFVLAVVEEELKATLKDDIRQAILINHGWSAAEIQSIAAAGTDRRLAGVQYALVDLAHRGTIIEPANAQPGDLIQYWMKKSDGTWFGHSAIISSVEGSKATIYGSHRSQGKIAESSFKLDLLGPNRWIYIVRLNP